MVLPCEYWLKALLSLEPAFSVAQVQSAVSLRKYAVPEKAYILSVREELEKTKPQPFDPNALHCIQWMKRNKIYDFVKRRPQVTLAATLLGTGNLRQRLEAMLLGSVPVDTIQYVISKYFGKELEVETIEYYRHFFWNTEVMGVDAWKKFLKDYPYGQRLWSIYISADPGAALLAIGEPLQLKPEDMLQYMTDQAFANFRAAATADPLSASMSRTARTWADIALQGIDIQDRRKSSSDTALQMLELLMLRYSGETPVTVTELTARGGKVIPLPASEQKRLTDG
jgi:hypothetical protein